MDNRQVLDIPQTYKIRIQGTIDLQWSDWFDAFTITQIEDDSLLTGVVEDQAALHGLLSKIRDLGMTLVSIEQQTDTQQRERDMTITGKIRPFDMQQDMAGMVDLIEIAFAGDLERWGSNFREQIEMAQKMIPLLKFLSRVSSVFRHTFDGFVWEVDGQIVSFVMVQKVGLSKTHWQIGNVATHPDYRRQGLAHKLVTKAMEHAQAHGATICTLEVRAVAEPAYNLYRSLGFVHYDSSTVLKLGKLLDKLPQVKTKSIDGYNLRPMKFGEWRDRYQLVLQETPQDVQDFIPVSEAEFRISPIERITTPLALRMQKLDVLRWAVEKDGKLVGRMLLAANRKPNLPHELDIHILSEHREALAEPLLTLALETLQTYPREATRISVRSSDTNFIALLERAGFVEIDVNHELGAKLNIDVI